MSLVLVLAAAAVASTAHVPAREIALQRVAGKGLSPQGRMVSSTWTGRSLSVVVRDARTAADPAVVGSQQEKGTLLYEWKASRPVPESVQAMIEQTLTTWWVKVAPDSPVRLEVTLEGLSIDEVPETFGSTYHAEVSLKGGIFDPKGDRITGHAVSGTGKSSGTDRRPKLCNEALTVALEDAVAKLMTSKETTAPKTAVLTPDAADPDAVPAKEMLQELMKLKEAGVGEPVMLGYVRQRRLVAPLSADDIVKWKESGLPESVIHAAQEVK